MYSVVFEMILFFIFISGALSVFLEKTLLRENSRVSVWCSHSFFIIVILHTSLVILMLHIEPESFLLHALPFVLFYCPFFLIVIRENFRGFAKVDYLCFIPAVLFLCWYLSIYFNLHDNFSNKHTYFMALRITASLVMGGFFFYGFVCVLKGLIVEKRWKYLVFIGICYWMVYTSVLLGFLILNLDFERETALWNEISYVFLLIIVGFLAFEKGMQFKRNNNSVKKEEVVGILKYAKSKKSLEELSGYKIQVDELLDQEVFLIHDLTLDDMSHQLKIPKHYLTQVFSFIYQSNFKQIINKHRILYASKLINEDYSIERIDDIAFNSGFSSKTSFYRAFKNEFNCTPLEFKKNKFRFLKRE